MNSYIETDNKDQHRYPSFPLRISPEIKEKLQQMAEFEDVSLNKLLTQIILKAVTKESYTFLFK